MLVAGLKKNVAPTIVFTCKSCKLFLENNGDNAVGIRNDVTIDKETSELVYSPTARVCLKIALKTVNNIKRVQALPIWPVQKLFFIQLCYTSVDVIKFC